MLKTLIFATHNLHKAHEIKHLLSHRFNVLCLSDLHFHEDIPETEFTFEGNAYLKSSFIHKLLNKDCFADDSGLEIDALDGKPGVFSARYAGMENNFEANMNKVLEEMRNIENRKARFRTVICLIMNNSTYYFNGSIEGMITHEKRGIKGFGYDPIFIPQGYNLTFAEMTLEQKNIISHRAIATRHLTEFLLGAEY